MTVDGKKLKFETHYNCSIIKTLNIITFPAELSIKNSNQNIKNGKITTRKNFWQCVRHILYYTTIHNTQCTLHVTFNRSILRDILTWPKTYNTSAILSCKTFTNILCALLWSRRWRFCIRKRRRPYRNRPRWISPGPFMVNPKSR